MGAYETKQDEQGGTRQAYKPNGLVAAFAPDQVFTNAAMRSGDQDSDGNFGRGGVQDMVGAMGGAGEAWNNSINASTKPQQNGNSIADYLQKQRGR